MEKSESGSLPAFVLDTLRNKTYGRTAVAGTAGFFVLYSFLSGFWLIPGLDFGILRTIDIAWYDVLYVIVTSLSAGLLLVFFKYKADTIKTTSRMAGIGAAAAGFFAASCPACQALSLTAFGATFFAIPLGPIVPYLWVLRIASLFILALAAYLAADSAYTKVCKPLFKVTK